MQAGSYWDISAAVFIYFEPDGLKSETVEQLSGAKKKGKTKEGW